MRFAFRRLAKTPGFTFTAIATLALAIGVCTAMFSVVRAVLLKPLPVSEPDRLVWIENAGDNGLSGRTSRADTVLGWREHVRSFSSLAAWFAFSDYGSVKMTGAGDPERVRDVGVSDNFLPTLGVPLLLGRNFTAEECQWSTDRSSPLLRAVILSHSFWQRRFAGDRAIVGQQIVLNGSPATIVGVLPASFDFDSIFTPGNEVDVLTPFPLCPQTARWGNTVFAIGRLSPGVTLAQATSELRLVTDNLKKSLPYPNGIGLRTSSLDEALRGRFRPTFLMLCGAVACVLAVACVNLSNLLLTQLNARRQEFAVRIALGASRSALIRQALAESLLLSSLGSLVGVPLAIWATALLARLRTFGVPLLQDSSVDPTALAFTLGITALTGLVCGLLPALYLARSADGASLQQATHQRTAGRSAGTARNILIIAEIALACMLLVGAGLLLRSFNAVLQVNLGFQPAQAMAWRVDPQRRFKSGEEAANYLGELQRRIAALPGVEAVGVSDTLPLGRNRSWGAGVIGVEYPPNSYPLAFPRIVDPHYLATMQIPLLLGRNFEAGYNPNAEKGVIINQSLARQLFGSENPLGRRIRANGESTVIGVAADVRHASLEEAGGNEMYLDYRQCGDWNAMDLVVRSRRPAESLIPEVRATLTQFDAGLPTGDYRSLDTLIDRAVGPRRLIARLLGFFSALTLGLAAIGLYGVMAFAVGQRRQEIGIRMALGAQRPDILRMILSEGGRVVAIGVALGLVGSLALSRVLQSQIFGVGAHDPLTYLAVVSLLGGTAMLACFLPARRATQVDPLVALRAE